MLSGVAYWLRGLDSNQRAPLGGLVYSQVESSTLSPQTFKVLFCVTISANQFALRYLFQDIFFTVP